jgi:hypothetical protein
MAEIFSDFKKGIDFLMHIGHQGSIAVQHCG